jgi:hypothetical protein
MNAQPMTPERLVKIVYAPCAPEKEVVALAYARITESGAQDFKAINAAIVQRYGNSGLVRVKRKAWAA